MYFETVEDMVRGAAEISAEPFDRFRDSAKSLSSLIEPYIAAFDTPPEKMDLLLGHEGLNGRAGNFGQLIASLRDLLKDTTDEKGHQAILRQTFFISTAEYIQSSVPGLHRDENVIAACNRIIRDIGTWADENIERIDAVDRLKILHERHNFAQALDDIYRFMKGFQQYFETHTVEIKAPKPYADLLRQQAAAAGIALPVRTLEA